MLRVLRLERDLRLVDHHSGVSVGGDGGGGLGVDIAATPGVLNLMDQGDDDQGHRDVEHQVQDRDPVLKPAPVRDHDHIDILEAGEDGDDQPGDEEAVVAEVGSKDEQQAAPHTKERVKHRVLDDWANTNVLVITLRVVIIIQSPDGLGVLDDVEDGHDHGEDELEDSDDDDGLLEGDPAHRGEAGPPSTHFVT